MKTLLKLRRLASISLFLLLALHFQLATTCTRTLYVSADGKLVITGRNMDWLEDIGTELLALPAGIKRNGGDEINSLTWVSRYGSVITSGYDLQAASDGMNEKGLVANLQYLTESNYGMRNLKRPGISILNWAQYVLDNFATVQEAVDALKLEPFQINGFTLPNGKAALIHLSISDPKGDSAILEYINGRLVIHHSKQYKVMTNSPTYEKQLALNEYWKAIGGLVFLPGTNRPADRFARASFFLEAIPKKTAKNYITAVPQQSFVFQAIASVTSLQRAVSVPLGITSLDNPYVSSTIWRTISDQTNLNYYFDSATSPNIFWVSLKNLDLKPGAPIKKLSLKNGRILSGEASSFFIEEPSIHLFGSPSAHRPISAG